MRAQPNCSAAHTTISPPYHHHRRSCPAGGSVRTFRAWLGSTASLRDKAPNSQSLRRLGPADIHSSKRMYELTCATNQTLGLSDCKTTESSLRANKAVVLQTERADSNYRGYLLYSMNQMLFHVRCNTDLCGCQEDGRSSRELNEENY